MFKVMITAASSNSGKTAVTCGLLALLSRKGYDPCAFKCGPDYIDPMFHRSVLGIESRNLDVFLAGEEGVRQAFTQGLRGHGAAVCEGVMGYYDGVAKAGKAGGAEAGDPASDDADSAGDALSARASAWHVARLCRLPAILVLRPKGAALTLAAVIRGMAEFKTPSRISGVIFNDCSEMYYRTYGPLIQQASGIPVLGFLPHMEEAVFESRHLGLMTAEEIRDLSSRIERIAEKMEETIDMEQLLAVMSGSDAPKTQDAPKLQGAPAEACRPAHGTRGSRDPENVRKPADTRDPVNTQNLLETREPVNTREPLETRDPANGMEPVRIAVARDAAFNFIYAESITALEKAGARIVWFSPLSDQALPEDIQGLYLPGGYPELYGKELSENVSMREQIRAAVTGGLPTIAECGGFLYLGETLADADGNTWPVAGALPGHGAGTGKLVRFGYGFIGCGEDSMLFRRGEQIPVHEFHYWDTTAQGGDLILTKNSNGKQWRFGYASQTLYAGFPHLYLAGRTGDGVDGNDTLAARFVEAARQYRDQGDR